MKLMLWYSIDQTPTNIVLEEEDPILPMGESYCLSGVVVTPRTAVYSLTWSSDNPSVATVENGKVTAHSPGTATIRVCIAENTSLQASCTVTVYREGYTQLTDGETYSGYLFGGRNDSYYYSVVSDGYVELETLGDTDTYLSVTYADADGGESRPRATTTAAKASTPASVFGQRQGTILSARVRHAHSTGTGAYQLRFTIPKAGVFTFQYPNEKDHFGIDMKGLNTKNDAEVIRQSIANMQKYNWYSIQDCNSYVFKNNMNREVLVYSGHGYKGYLSFPDNSFITATELKNSNRLSRTKLAVFCACYSNSPDGDTSMTQAAVEAEAPRSLLGGIMISRTVWQGNSCPFSLGISLRENPLGERWIVRKTKCM